MNKKIRYLILISIVLIFATNLFLNKKDASSHKKIIIGNRVIRAENAESVMEKQKGLSGRNFMRKNNGMLFTFSQSDYYSFWMKDMKFPIDIIWIDENLRIINIEKNITPDTFPKKFIPQLPAKYVLEVNGGWSDKNEIKEGINIKVKP
ncbi:MAG: hypothetical protein UW04_C0005G0004 [Parcubacteria group bacterium GW2011_GWB1_43_8]|nr:MAG: hypothetical protein UW04_C0005G0004 [Parcubacteria group bacterium GW2011_GWB1_43_8]